VKLLKNSHNLLGGRQALVSATLSPLQGTESWQEPGFLRGNSLHGLGSPIRKTCYLFLSEGMAVVKPLNLVGLVLSLLLVVPWLGCADPGGGREAVSGEIRFKGEPLDQGTIQFIPSAETT
jgi:hypothetical protein